MDVRPRNQFDIAHIPGGRPGAFPSFLPLRLQPVHYVLVGCSDRPSSPAAAKVVCSLITEQKRVCSACRLSVMPVRHRPSGRLLVPPPCTAGCRGPAKRRLCRFGYRVQRARPWQWACNGKSTRMERGDVLCTNKPSQGGCSAKRLAKHKRAHE